MEVVTLEKELNSLAYHGRGIVIGKSADGTKAVIAYFIMGRSENSRNRVFVEDGEGITHTGVSMKARWKIPHLIIYAPVRVLGNKTIVTNGDQTDTIYELMDKQMTFEQALRTREFEDDKPNYTPRISGIVHLDNGDMNYRNVYLKERRRRRLIMSEIHLRLQQSLETARASSFTPTRVTVIPCRATEGEPKTVVIPDMDIDTFTINDMGKPQCGQQGFTLCTLYRHCHRQVRITHNQ